MAQTELNTKLQKKNKKKKQLSLKQQRLIFVYSSLAIPLLFFIFIRFAPTLYTFNVGFHEWTILSDVKPFVGLENYIGLFNDEVFRQALKNTFVYVIFGVTGQLIVGLGIALLLQRINKFVGFFRVIYFIPYVTSIVAVSWIFKWLFMNNGIINNVLIDLGFEKQLFLSSPDQAIYVIIASMIWQGIGFQMVIFLAGLENIPKMFYEAAEIDGANSWQKFRRITLPLLNPTIVFSAVIGSIAFLQTFTQVQNMTMGGPLNSTNSMVHYIYELAFQRFQMGYASAATVILFLIVLALTLFQMKVLTRKFDY
ncbi:sugar ABC transporter permease [Bacillus carboniphilus]|uniref:Sugar ABC transporter permease n=1 Tax=Bacillus carboniphilus TaxID=86663 RepID=A0ABP3GA28_9BACI